MNTKRVLWSGGCDSTLLLYQLAKKYQHETIHAYTIESPFLKIKQNIWETYSNNIKKYLHQQNIHNIQYNYLYFNINNNDEKIQPKQKSFLGYNIIHWSNISTILEDNDVLYIGYIKEDFELHYRTEILNYFKVLSDLLFINVVVEFPFEFISKVDILEELEFIGLDKYTMWCNNLDDENKPCYVCRNCILHEMAVGGLRVKKTGKPL